MLSNFDLMDIAKHYNIQLHEVCMKDELPARIKNGNYIINLQSSIDDEGNLNGGSHWTCLIVKNKQSFFFDPFGAYPSAEIQDYIKKRRGCKFGFNNKIIQDLKSDLCGYFCISLLLYCKRHKGNLFELAEKYTEIFDENTKLNDNILKQLFVKYSNQPYHKVIKRLLNQK